MKYLKNIDGIPPENIAGIFVDSENEKILVFTKDILVNQLQREAPDVAKSFDVIFDGELRQLSESLSFVLPIIATGQKQAIRDGDELIQTCGLLLQNASNTIIASAECLREGFRLQSGILIRSVIEICAVIFHLIKIPEDLQKFNMNKFNSTKAISTAQEMLPLFGRIWGALSKQFIHITSFHSEWHPLHKYTDRTETAATTIIGILGLAVYFLKISAELTFINYIAKPHHWIVKGAGVVEFVPPTAEEVDWISKVLDD